MTGSQAIAPLSVRRTASRRVGLRRASLAILILVIAEFGLGTSVNLYVTLPVAGHPGHGSFYSNGPLLALHATIGLFLLVFAIAVLVRAIRARTAIRTVTSAAGLAAILLAAFCGSMFTNELSNGYSLGMALATAAALACYATGLYAASARRGLS
jgi:hypothetical protein